MLEKWTTALIVPSAEPLAEHVSTVSDMMRIGLSLGCLGRVLRHLRSAPMGNFVFTAMADSRASQMFLEFSSS